MLAYNFFSFNYLIDNVDISSVYIATSIKQSMERDMGSNCFGNMKS